MPSDVRPMLREMVKAARTAQLWLDAGDLELVLWWLRRLGIAVDRVRPAVRALRPDAPWSAGDVLLRVDPSQAGVYSVPLIENLIHNEAHALGEAAAGILAELEAAGLHSPTPVVAPPAVYQFTITLTEITPLIWRRFLISNQVTLRRLHNVIQIVCGWRNCHLHRFEIAGTEYGRPDPLEDMHLVGDTRVVLAKLPLTQGTRFRYEYDFGDSWEHELLLEKVLPAEDAPVHPVCLGGERAFPLEDSGGVDGYYDTLRALRMPDHPDHRSLCEWAGPGYDPEGFDLEAANRRLRNAGGRRRQAC